MCRIDDVKFAEPKFAKGPSDFDICIHGTSVNDPNQGDYWRGEMSQNYGKGNFASMTQAEITIKTLRSLGFEGSDLTTLSDQIKDKVVPFHVEASDPSDNGKIFYNVKYIEQGQAVQEIDADTVNARVAVLFAKNADKTEAPVQAPQKTVANNPFAKKPATGAATATKQSTGTKSPF
jgi:hypothetical protein